MSASKKYYKFGDLLKFPVDNENLPIVINPDNDDPQTSLAIWPCAKVLSLLFYQDLINFDEFYERQIENQEILKILDFGSGQSPLVSIILDKIMTKKSAKSTDPTKKFNYQIEKYDKIANSKHNVKRFDFTDFENLKLNFSSNDFSYIICSDLFYDEANFDYILAALKFICKESSFGKCKVICAVEIREVTLDVILEGYFARWGVEMVEVVFEVNGSIGFEFLQLFYLQIYDFLGFLT